MSDAPMKNANLEAVRFRRAQVSDEIRRLKAEDAQLQIAEQVLRRLTPEAFVGATPIAQRAAPRPGSRKPTTPRSQRDLVLRVLQDCDDPWLSTREVIDQIKQKWSVAIPEKSLRPLLSLLKRDGDIVRHGRVVALADRAIQAYSRRE
jgi:hypothetical protein